MPVSGTISAALHPEQTTLFADRVPDLHTGLLLVMTIAVMALVAVPATVGSVVFVLLAVHALRGQRQVIEAFTLLFFAMMCNPAIQPAASGSFRWLVIFAGLTRVGWDGFFNSERIRIPWDSMWIFAAFIIWAAMGAFLSRVPVLSMLKLISFTVGVVTLLTAFSSTLHLAEYWRSWFHTYFLFILVTSALVFPTGAGYIRTTQGFQGIFSHPQLLGPIAGIACAWFTGLFMSTQRRPPLYLTAAVGLSWGLLFLSAARTGAAAVGGGLIVTVMLLGFSRVKRDAWGGIKGTRLWTFAVVGLTALVFGGGVIITHVGDFINKDDTESMTPEELFEATRGSLVAQSMDNFYVSPVAGIGFGVPSHLARMEGGTNELMGIPVGASSEKGFMPTAILEEVGLVGAVLVVMFMWVVSTTIIRWGGLLVSWMYWAALLVNVGAAVFFSIGGLGFFMWIMIAFCYSQAEAKKHTLVQEYARMS